MKHGKYRTRKARKQDTAQSARKFGRLQERDSALIGDDVKPLSLGAQALAIVANVFTRNSRKRG